MVVGVDSLDPRETRSSRATDVDYVGLLLAMRKLVLVIQRTLRECAQESADVRLEFGICGPISSLCRRDIEEGGLLEVERANSDVCGGARVKVYDGGRTMIHLPDSRNEQVERGACASHGSGVNRTRRGWKTGDKAQ